MNIVQRKIDIEDLIKGLDITPTMYENARTKYQRVGKYLHEKGMNVDIFPQGSFAIGTVVRPYTRGADKSYDLDFICLNNVEKHRTSPKDEKFLPYNALMESAAYKEILCSEEYDKCWTLEYAKVSDSEFNMDIVPAVSEDYSVVRELLDQGLDIKYSQKVIAITDKKNNGYRWSTSNPKAYKEWFDEINKPFLENGRFERRNKILQENRKFFASIEEIPAELEHSALQRVIQILKRHRDVYFSKKHQEDNKPISAIITTIAAEIAKSSSSTVSIIELLQYVVKEFEVYSNWQRMEQSVFESCYNSKKVITRNNGKWEIKNPVNPKDNLADSWIQNSSKATYFFEWVKQLKKDFVDAFTYEDDEFIATLENGFGTSYVQRMIKKEHYNLKASQEISATPKHWRMHE